MCYIHSEGLIKKCSFKEAVNYQIELAMNGHKSKIFDDIGREIINVTLDLNIGDLRKGEYDMGYQEVYKKVNNLKELKIIEKAIVRDNMGAFIEFLGAHEHPIRENEYYLFFKTDHHPGADYLIENFNFEIPENDTKKTDEILEYPFMFPKAVYKKI